MYRRRRTTVKCSSDCQNDPNRSHKILKIERDMKLCSSVAFDATGVFLRCNGLTWDQHALFLFLFLFLAGLIDVVSAESAFLNYTTDWISPAGEQSFLGSIQSKSHKSNLSLSVSECIESNQNHISETSGVFFSCSDIKMSSLGWMIQKEMDGCLSQHPVCGRLTGHVLRRCGRPPLLPPADPTWPLLFLARLAWLTHFLCLIWATTSIFSPP